MEAELGQKKSTILVQNTFSFLLNFFGTSVLVRLSKKKKYCSPITNEN